MSECPDGGNGDFDRILSALAAADTGELESLSRVIDGFPHGVDSFLGLRWISNAIDCGSPAAIAWMLERGIDLSFREKDGFTVLHATINRRAQDRYDILTLLLQHGAPIDARGVNDWTPAHMAAARDDVDALRLLVRHGADLSLRTRIDRYATALEEARSLQAWKAVRFLESIEPRQSEPPPVPDDGMRK